MKEFNTFILLLSLFSLFLLHFQIEGKINLKNELENGYTVSLLPNAAEESSYILNNIIHAKISEIEYNRNKNTDKKENGDGYYGFLPVYEASLFPNKPASHFDGTCFKKYSAQLTTFNATGATLKFEVESKTFNPLCFSDILLIASLSTFRFHLIDKVGSTTMDLMWVNELEKQNVEENGFVVFYLPDGILGTVLDIWDTYQLFMGPKSFEDGIQFYKDHMNITFTNRTVPGFMPDETEIMDGDYIGTFSFQSGAEGEGLSTLIAWGTGSHTTHTAVCLRINGTLYVLESNGEGIQKTPYKDWMNPASDVIIALARLKPEIVQKFDSEAAVAWFSKVEGLPYGYENFIYGWIDTLNGNYPPPYTSEDIPVILVLGHYLLPTEMDLVFAKGLNKRLGTSGLSVIDILDYCVAKNLSIGELVTYPEMDDYVYSDPTGPRMVCDVFVMQLYRQAGVFGDIEFQATELTPKDSYQVQIFDANWQRPQGCANDLNTPGYCQTSGMYWLELPNFNSIPPYANMDQQCSAIPPKYIRTPTNC